MPEVGQIYPNQTVPVAAFPPKKSTLKYFVVSGISLVLIIALSFGYFFWWVPQASAKEFITKTSESFEQVSQKVGVVQQGFTNIKKESSLATSSFEETAHPTTDYDYITKDTDQDIVDIEELLSSLEKARDELRDLKKPESVENLATALDQYYSDLEEASNGLLDHQKINRDLLAANGKDLYDKAVSFEKLYNSGGVRTDFVQSCQDIAQLSQQAYEKALLIKNINPIDQNYYNNKLAYFKDMWGTFEKAAPLYQEGKDKEASDLLDAFSNRNKQGNAEIQTICDKYVTTSYVALDFKKLPDLEKKVEDELQTLAEKYDLNISSSEGSKVASPSAK